MPLLLATAAAGLSSKTVSGCGVSSGSGADHVTPPSVECHAPIVLALPGWLLMPFHNVPKQKSQFG